MTSVTTLSVFIDRSRTRLGMVKHRMDLPTLGAKPRNASLLTRRPRLRLMPGQTIPGTSWQIIRWLGEGGMGVVYEARHVEINRRAALKIISGPLGEDPAALASFRREATASAKIEAPNIAGVFDFAVLEDGRLMMAMEFVPGRSLRDIHVEEKRLSPSRLIGLFRQVCKGLQAAHESDLVHCDIKPENIMIGDIAGRHDTVKIVDFGIVTIMGERSVRLAGTPYYMPPEGLENGAIDGRYDIYSVGCVMWEMLTGAPPFMHDSVERVLQMHLYSPVPELVTDDPAVPRKLIEVIRRCVAKDPADRYASMNELEAALCEAQIEGKLRTTWDDLVLPLIDPERRAKLLAKMPTRTRKRGVSGWWLPVLLVFGVVVGGVAALPMLRTDPELAQSLANTSSEIEGFVDRIHQSAALAYYVYPPVDDPHADTAYKVLIQLEALDGEAALVAAASLRAQLATTLVRLGDEIWDEQGGEPFALDFYVQATMFDPAIEPARTRAAMSPGELLALRRKAGTGDFSESELIAVEPLLALAEPDAVAKQAKLEAIELRRRDKRRAGAAAQLDTLIAIESDEPPPSQPYSNDELDGADGLDQIVPVPANKGAADKLVSRANTARKAARYKDAEKLYHKALRIEEHRVDALAGLGRVYFEQGNYSKAVTYYGMAVRRSGRDANLRIALGDAYLKTLDYEQALEQYEKAKVLGSSKAAERIKRVSK